MQYMTDWLIVPAIVIMGIAGYYALNVLFINPKSNDHLDYTGERYLDLIRRRMDRSQEYKNTRTWR